MNRPTLGYTGEQLPLGQITIHVNNHMMLVGNFRTIQMAAYGRTNARISQTLPTL